jgi:hypothetical protein
VPQHPDSSIGLKQRNCQAPVVHACHPNLCRRLRSTGSQQQGQCWQKIFKTSISMGKKKIRHCHLSDGGKLKMGGSWSRLAWTTSETISKITRAKEKRKQKQKKKKKINIQGKKGLEV